MLKYTEIETKFLIFIINFALTAVENNIPHVSSLVKKTDYNTKICEIENKVSDYDHDKYITTSEFNK